MAKKRKIQYTKDVFEQIENTIGSYAPETGGVLLYKEPGIVSKYIFDYSATTTSGSYTPDIATLNPKIRAAMDEGYKIAGMIHSHPSGCKQPSPADIEYGGRIIDAFDTYNLLIPIITFKKNGEMELRSYLLENDGSVTLCEHDVIGIEYDVSSSSPGLTKSKRVDGRFDRIASALDFNELSKKTVVCVGCGGAADLMVSLARCGVTEFVLMDHDVYSPQNIANQFAAESCIGMRKVDTLKSRILDVNHKAKVAPVKMRLDDKLEDKDIEKLIGKKLRKKPEDVLICGFTDDFYAQARTAALAVKYGTPYIAAQMYLNGDAAEVFFSYPGVTPCCPRCALESRYQAYRNGFKNDVTSNSSTIFSTMRVNAICGQIILALLQYGAGGGRYSTYLDTIKDRNFLQIKITPLDKVLNLGIFDELIDPELEFCDQAVWIPQIPNDGYESTVCPLCGGEGNLLKSKDTIKDTRENLI